MLITIIKTIISTLDIVFIIMAFMASQKADRNKASDLITIIISCLLMSNIGMMWV